MSVMVFDVQHITRMRRIIQNYDTRYFSTLLHSLALLVDALKRCRTFSDKIYQLLQDQNSSSRPNIILQLKKKILQANLSKMNYHM